MELAVGLLAIEEVQQQGGERAARRRLAKARLAAPAADCLCPAALCTAPTAPLLAADSCRDRIINQLQGKEKGRQGRDGRVNNEEGADTTTHSRTTDTLLNFTL